jgi:hypothetical protein
MSASRAVEVAENLAAGFNPAKALFSLKNIDSEGGSFHG